MILDAHSLWRVASFGILDAPKRKRDVRLSDEAVRDIRTRTQTRDAYAAKYGCSLQFISHIQTGRSRKSA